MRSSKSASRISGRGSGSHSPLNRRGIENTEECDPQITQRRSLPRAECRKPFQWNLAAGRQAPLRNLRMYSALISADHNAFFVTQIL